MGTWTEFGTFVADYLLNVLAAVGILVVGWVLAWLLAGLTRKALQRTRLHQHLATGIAGAVLLLALAWGVATLLREPLKRGLAAVRLDERLTSAAMEAGETSLSASITHAVYWLVFLLFLPAILSTLALTGLLGPVTRLVDEILATCRTSRWQRSS